MGDLSHYRKSYDKSQLDEHAAPNDPMALFEQWFGEVEASGKEGEVNTMTVSTIDPAGYPKARVVLLKQYDANGFVFFTNYDSEKGKAIAAHPKVCLSFFWPSLERQVIIKGEATKISGAESDHYFASRPQGSQLGAKVSPQSAVIASRDVLESALSILEKEFAGKPITRPGNWGGYRVAPIEMEFWQGRPNRLHDRLRYRLQADRSWKRDRLAP